MKTSHLDAAFPVAAVILTIAGIFLLQGALDGALAQGNPFGVGPRAAPPPPPAEGVMGWIFAKQAEFYRMLSGSIRAAKADSTAVAGLFGVSFLYGVFHAAGPGHGKAVISSYLVANNETWRRGLVLSFASALLQALVAVALVAIAALLIGATARAMGDTVRIIEIVSYSLIIAIGARLLWVKGRAFVRELRGHENHHGHHRRHEHDAACHHDIEPARLAGPGGWRRGFSAIVAVGLRPCSGAILVLIFALAQGIFWAGIGATFVMGLGTAITVAAIATMAVGARAFAGRIAHGRSGWGMLALRGIEVAAAALIIAFGALLLTGYMASERMFV
ncbi:MAG: nickel transporter [Xanthobacteraceae bacterium]